MSLITLASWNVNSLKVRLSQVTAWLAATKTDALVLQETKLTDDAFPKDVFSEIGYDAVFTGQKTYNGVALLTRRETMKAPASPDFNMPGYPDDQKRFIAADICPKDAETPVRFVGGYFPNGMAPGSWKYLYKLDWIEALTHYLEASLKRNPRVVLGGDFNIAPEDADVWDPVSWKNRILVTPSERLAFAGLLNLGFEDSFRQLHPEEVRYSWWDYRMKAFENNHGLRIDHLLVSKALSASVKDAEIDAAPRHNAQPSDHAPVTVTIEL